MPNVKVEFDAANALSMDKPFIAVADGKRVPIDAQTAVALGQFQMVELLNMIQKSVDRIARNA